MKKYNTHVSLIILLIFPLLVNSQQQAPAMTPFPTHPGLTVSKWKENKLCRIKLGGVFFINMKDLIKFGNESIFTITKSTDEFILINFNIYDNSGKKIGEIKNGLLESGDAKRFNLVGTADEFTLGDKFTQTIIMHVTKLKNNDYCDLKVWLEMFLPDGNQFIASPEESNLNLLQNIRGATFEGGDTGIQLQ